MFPRLSRFSQDRFDSDEDSWFGSVCEFNLFHYKVYVTQFVGNEQSGVEDADQFSGELKHLSFWENHQTKNTA